MIPFWYKKFAGDFAEVFSHVELWILCVGIQWCLTFLVHIISYILLGWSVLDFLSLTSFLLNLGSLVLFTIAIHVLGSRVNAYKRFYNLPRSDSMIKSRLYKTTEKFILSMRQPPGIDRLIDKAVKTLESKHRNNELKDSKLEKYESLIKAYEEI